MRPIADKLHLRRSIAPVASLDDAPLVGEIVDMLGFESLTYAIAVGTVGDADAVFAVLLEDGDDRALKDARVVGAGDLLGSTQLAGFRFDDDNEPRKLGYRGIKRYTRLTITPSGNSGTPGPVMVSALGLLGTASVAAPSGTAITFSGSNLAVGSLELEFS